jgi:hypothetical protein
MAKQLVFKNFESAYLKKAADRLRGVGLSAILSTSLWAQVPSQIGVTPPASAPEPTTQSADAAPNGHGNDDVLAINVWEEPDISDQFRSGRVARSPFLAAGVKAKNKAS